MPIDIEHEPRNITTVTLATRRHDRERRLPAGREVRGREERARQTERGAARVAVERDGARAGRDEDRRGALRDADNDVGLAHAARNQALKNTLLRSVLFYSFGSAYWALLPLIPAGRRVVTESGIHTDADVAAMRAHGVAAFLVGESLMRADDPGARLAQLFGPLRLVSP